MKRRMIGATLLTAALVGATTPPAAAETDRPELRKAMAELLDAGAAGVQVRLADEGERWTGTAGSKYLDKQRPVPENGRFRVGSITKTMVATVLLQLVDEGKVQLDRSAAGYLPEFGLDKRITVRMLLQHTSGLFNYTGEPRPDESIEPGIPLDGKGFLKNRYRTYSPHELIDVSLSKPARFEPGTQWSYSNTNYILLGLLIEKKTRSSYAEEVSKRVLEPLGLRQTSLPGTKFGIDGPHAHGYYGFRDGDDFRSLDVTKLNPSWAFSAGEVISTTKDLDVFVQALLDGKLTSPKSLEEMRKFRETGPTGGYGLGLLEVKLPAECGGATLGHTGGIHGYNSYMFSNADGSKRFEMSVSHADIDSSDPETAARFAAAQEKVMTTALCGKSAPTQRLTQLVPLS